MVASRRRPKHAPMFQAIRLLAAAALIAALALAQTADPGSKKADADATRIGKKDPFTEGEAKAMTALGILAYGPLPWGDGLRTDAVDAVLGANRILWFETAHFRFGCNLATIGIPEEPDARKLVNGELQRLNGKWSKMPERASKLDPWLRAHLYAQRAEELYADFATLIGSDETARPNLGAPDKFLILLFQKRSDLARYLDRFCGMKAQNSTRFTTRKSGQGLLVLSAEADDVHDEAAVHAQFRFLLMQTLQDALRGMPYWLSIGVAHHYERQVPTNLINAGMRETDHVDAGTQHKWPQKMRARAARETLCVPFATLCTSTDFGYFEHVQVWSRVDYLLALDRSKFGKFVAGLAGNGSSSRQTELLEEIFGMDTETFDRQWREWATKTYPK